MAGQHQDELLQQHLRAFLGPVDAQTLHTLTGQLQWVELPGGKTLIAQGDAGDSMYLCISGRLRAYVRDDTGTERLVREMSRGEVVGEMSLYTDEPRSATVVAIRDSVLVRLGKAQFQQLLQGHPMLSLALTRQIIRRLQGAQPRSGLARPVTITLLPISADVDAAAFSRDLAAQLQHLHPPGRVCVVDADAVDAGLAEPGLARGPVDAAHAAQAAQASRRIALWLDELEARHDVVLLVADDQPNAWTERCTRRCDELLLLAQAAQPPRLHPSEERFLAHRSGRAEATERLVLLHPAEQRCPSGTRQWLARRPLGGHVHIRPALARDMARLARLQSRTAVGLVLAGGGARGLAHLGVCAELQARGVEVDCVGGTSIGALMAALVAADRPLSEMTEVTREAFQVNPTGDFNWLPLISLIKGRRLRDRLGQSVQRLFGCQPDVEDLWKSYFCVVTNYSQAAERVVQHGPLAKAMLASISIPGALPPVLHEGDLLCDGGTFNNFPVDVMRTMPGVGRVIGVDLGVRSHESGEPGLDEVPGNWALLRDRLRPRASRRYRFPSLVGYLMNVTVLYSTSRQRQSRRLTDLYFSPPLARFGMLQWEQLDEIVEQGRRHAAELLDSLDAQALAPYRGGGQGTGESRSSSSTGG